MADAAKLPVWRTVYDAHVITIENFLTLLRVGWVWVLLLAVTDAALHWFLWPWEEAAIAQGGSGSMSLLLLSTYVWTLFGACVAVPWHHFGTVFARAVCDRNQSDRQRGRASSRSK